MKPPEQEDVERGIDGLGLFAAEDGVLDRGGEIVPALQPRDAVENCRFKSEISSRPGDPCEHGAVQPDIGKVEREPGGDSHALRRRHVGRGEGSTDCRGIAADRVAAGGIECAQATAPQIARPQIAIAQNAPDIQALGKPIEALLHRGLLKHAVPSRLRGEALGHGPDG